MANDIVKLDDKGIVLNNLADVKAYVTEIVATAFCPKAYLGKPRDAMIAILAGRNVGLNPLQALRGIAVINGRPSMYGEDRSAVVQAGGQVEWVKEWFEIDGKAIVPQFNSLRDFPDNLMACWQTKRKDRTEPSAVVRFRVADAKTAGLWTKTGPWSQYPARMLTMRARAWGERDNYGDALAGIDQAEEVLDLPKHEKSKLELAVEGEIVPPEATSDVQEAVTEAIQDFAAGQAPKHEAPPVAAPLAKVAALAALIDGATQYIARRGVANALPVNALIEVVRDKLIGHKFADAGEIETVRRAILAGEFDLESGDLIPPA